MKIICFAVGHRHDGMLAAAIDHYTKKVNHYYKCSWEIIQPPKVSITASPDMVRQAEMIPVLRAVEKADRLILLDERGQMLSSPALADTVANAALASSKSIGFLIGGAFGVHEEVRRRANLVWSLSDLVFPHQLVRLLLAEQLYRACSILRNEKYHHS